MFEVMTGNHQGKDERRDNHPVAWILIESTSSGILQNTSRVSSFRVEDRRTEHTRHKHHRHNLVPSRYPPNR